MSFIFRFVLFSSVFGVPSFFFPHSETVYLLITDSIVFPIYAGSCRNWLGRCAMPLVEMEQRWRKNYIWALNKIWTYVPGPSPPRTQN